MIRASENSPKPRLIVGINGGSAAIYGVRLLELLQGAGIETHLIMSRAAQVTLAHETDLKVSEIEKLATVVHSNSDVGAACSSGSFRTLGIVIAACSIKTMAVLAISAAS